MKKLQTVLTALLISLMTNVEATSQIEAIRQRLGLSDNGILVEGKHTIYIIGEITPGLALAFKDAADQAPAVDTVIVDSPGGDMSSAIDIANLIYRRKLNIVIDGRCFSACANYLFPAGNVKSARPHSFLGIHNRTYNYLDGNTVKHTTRLDEIQAAGKKVAPKEYALIIERLRKKESEFITQVNYSNSLDQAFSTYMRHRDLALAMPAAATRTGTCPRINLWVLRRGQLESIGLKNIVDFWEPRTSEERKILQIYFKVPLAESFFGTATELENLCTVEQAFSYRKIK